MLSCVVFDIDDTLYLESDYVRSGFRAAGMRVVELLEKDGFAAEAWSLFLAGGREKIFDGALRRLGIAPEAGLVADLVSTYRSHRPDIRLLPDAEACLASLAGRAHLAVVSDGPLESQTAKARALRLDRWISTFVYTAALGDGFGKPHPRAFEIVEFDAACPGPECSYVADNPSKDFAGPGKRGWTTVRVRRPGGLHWGVASGRDVGKELADLSGLVAALGLEPGDGLASPGGRPG